MTSPRWTKPPLVGPSQPLARYSTEPCSCDECASLEAAWQRKLPPKLSVMFGRSRVRLPRPEAEQALALLDYVDERGGDVTLVLNGRRFAMRVGEALQARRQLEAALTRRAA